MRVALNLVSADEFSVIIVAQHLDEILSIELGLLLLFVHSWYFHGLLALLFDLPYSFEGF